jgi:acyl-CoA thioesterase-1
VTPFGLALTLVFAATLAHPPQDVAAHPQIVALGDSLTSGEGIGVAKAYPAVLQEWLDEAALPLTMVNEGVSGDTTRRAENRLDRALAGDVRVLIIALGANDGVRGVPIDQIKANISRLIETAQARGIAVLLCGMETLPVHGWEYTVAFHLAWRELAERYSVPLVPFMLTNVIGDASMMQRDRIHPSAAGAREIAKNIWPYLKPLVVDAAVVK